MSNKASAADTNAPTPAEATMGADRTRSQSIQAILDGRKPHRDNVRILHTQLEHLEKQLEAIEGLTGELSAIAPAVSPNAESTSNSFTTLRNELKDQLKFLQFLKHRYERETLNVAVVGKKRSGKSALLGSMSGLSNEIIPRRDSIDPCTGARSKMLHRDKDEITGKVTFHSNASMLKIIHLYWTELKLPKRPALLQQFLELSALPPLPSELIEDGTRIEYYRSLEKYHKFLKPLWNVYGDKEPLIIQEAEIKDYVTQPEHNPLDPQAYKFLVVKEVEIFCRFPGQNQDIEGIGLIDLPGLGEATLGGPERVQETLETEADVLLFVFQPGILGAINDPEILDTYKVCKTALDKFVPLKDWAYLVINHRADEILNNEKATEHAKQYVARQKTEPQPTMLYRSDVICDVSKPEAVQTTVLQPLLRDMMHDIGRLDAQFGRRYMQDLGKWQSKVDAELNRVAQVLNTSPTFQQENVFETRFTGVWDSIREAINRLHDELQAVVDEPDAQLQKIVKVICDKMRDQISRFDLSPELADKLIYTQASYWMVHEEYCHRLRAEITQLWFAHDQALTAAVDAARAKIVNIFKDPGQLGDRVADGSLKSLGALLEGSDSLYEAVRYLDSFQLSAREVLSYKIRHALAQLEPLNRDSHDDGSPLRERLIRNLKEALENAVSSLEENLDASAATAPAYQQRTISCQQDQRPQLASRSTLPQILSSQRNDYAIPNQCAFAIVAEFRDMVIFDPGARGKWSTFYRQHRAEIWAADFQIFEDTAQLRRSLQQHIDEARSLNRDVALRIASSSV